MGVIKLIVLRFSWVKIVHFTQISSSGIGCANKLQLGVHWLQKFSLCFVQFHAMCHTMNLSGKMQMIEHKCYILHILQLLLKNWIKKAIMGWILKTNYLHRFNCLIGFEIPPKIVNAFFVLQWLQYSFVCCTSLKTSSHWYCKSWHT